MSIKLKVCGMREPENIASLTALAPDYMGFIFYEQSKRFVGDLNPQLLKNLPRSIKATGVFVDEKPESIMQAIHKYQLQAVQLHGSESPDFCVELKLQDPKSEIIKAFGLNDSFNFEQLNDYVGKVDYFLFDTQTPGHGGSGKTFNWQVLKNYKLDVPYFLSGGIGLEQLEEIKTIMDPILYAVDVNSRFETAAAVKDVDQLTIFKNQMLRHAQ